MFTGGLGTALVLLGLAMPAFEPVGLRRPPRAGDVVAGALLAM